MRITQKQRNYFAWIVTVSSGLLTLFLGLRVLQSKSSTSSMTPSKIGPAPEGADQLRPLLKEWQGMANLILAQMRHETGNFSSDLYRRANNAFGMKIPVQRPFTRTGTTGVYSAYRDWVQSVDDMVFWLRFNRFPTNLRTPDEYAYHLKKKRFYEDTEENYRKGLQRWL